MISKFFMDHKASGDWAARRRIIFISLIWSGLAMSAIIGWAMFHVQTNPLLDTAFINLNGLIGLIFASYVFGSIADDKNKAKQPSAPDTAGQPNPTGQPT
ncbi:hypothetical protein [Rhizobium sp. ERR 1071]|uniref:hypothetical protein n=1 Tax=Rhizobium sp. ERR 1071 TaxID=2572677 RepID=UPI0011A5FD1E|nr:hypothetical protein [Rhizobium sp. ERR1071]